MADQNEDQGNPASQNRRTSTAATARPGPVEEHRPAREDALPTAVAGRKRQYVVGVRPLPGATPMSPEGVLRALNVMQDVEIVRELPSPEQAGIPLGGSATAPNILVVRTDERRGEALRQSAPFNLIVEPDAPLRFTDVMSTAQVGGESLPLPCPHREIAFRIVGDNDKPLAGASVFLYGSAFPAHAVSDASGHVSLPFYDLDSGSEGRPPAANAVYIKPAADHWDRFIADPDLRHGTNTIRLRPLTEAFPRFPGERLIGWGMRLMRRDLFADAMDGKGVRVGLLDSGCDNTHAALRHVTQGADMIDPNQSQGWTRDTIGHGTHCAGIITGGSQPRDGGVMGFAPKAELHVLKVLPGGRISDLIAALDECVRQQLDIAVIGVGFDRRSELVAAKLAQAQQNGLACIAAAGRWGGPGQFPGATPGVLAVSAVGKLGEFPPDSFHALTAFGERFGMDGVFAPSFAGSGQHVAVAAPGSAVVSTVPGGGHAAWDGNAMAAAHVGGFAALLLAHHPSFQGTYRARGFYRAAALLECIRIASAPLAGIDPLRVGAGVPDLGRVPEWALAAGRSGTMSQAAAGIGTGAPAASFSPPLVPGAFMSAPDYLAGLMQLRAIGMI